MPSRRRFAPALGPLAVAVLLVPPGAHAAESVAARSSPQRPPYVQREPSFDGTGRFYMGREIARVMGHQGAAWLERPERVDEEQPEVLLSLLDLRPGMVVADIGAGTGYHSWRIARKVLPGGRVLAVDIQPEMLELLERQMTHRGVTNVEPVLGTVTDPRLPSGAVDLVLLVDVYHEFDHPFEMLAAIVDSLKPDGRVAFVEFRGEQASVPIKPLHKMTEEQIRKEAEVHALEWVATRRELPWQHLVIFRKSGERK